MAKSDHKTDARTRKTQTAQQRQLKVYSTYSQYRPKQHRPGGPQPIPWIQLKGLWLKQAGFDPNSDINVQVKKGRIVITRQGQ